MSQSSKNTRSNRYTLIASAVAMAAILAMAPTWSDAHEPAMSASKPMPAGQMDHSRMAGMQHMAGMSMTGDVDHDFATNMRKHHQMGVDMAQAQIKSGKSAEMRRMAQNIITAQKKEIAALDRWLAAHKKAMAAGNPKPNL